MRGLLPRKWNKMLVLSNGFSSPVCGDCYNNYQFKEEL